MKINMIYPYCVGTLWVFDDPDTGLVKEPFVKGSSTIIDLMFYRIAEDPAYFLYREEGYATLLFSDKNVFKGSSHNVFFLERGKEEDGGCWYKEAVSGQEGWLCPQLFKYFDSPPETIYAKLIV